MDQLIIPLIGAYVLSVRATAIVFGVLVSIDSVKIISGHETTRIRPRSDAAVWLLLAILCTLGASVFIYYGRVTIGRMDAVGAQFGVAIVWSAIATAFVCRLALRSKRPELIVRMASGFMSSAFALTLLEVFR